MTLANDQWQEAMVQLANTGLAITNANSNGQAAMAASSPVVIASDQSALPIKIPAWTQVYSTTQTGVSTWAGSGNITGLGVYRSLAVNINLTAITGTSIQFVLGRRDANNNFIFLKQTSAMTATGSNSIDVGDALTGYFLSTGVITVNLVAITSVTFTVDVQAR